MTVSTLTTYNEAAAGGTVYYFTFRCDDASWVKTYVGGALQSSGITVALNADQEASPGGSVTFGSATASTVRIERETPLTQETNYTAYDAFPAETHELALDKAVMLVQDEARDRAAADAVNASAIVSESAARLAADQAEAAARAAADALIIASGAEPANVGIAPVIATGSTEVRTVADRFADTVNVKDFGAVGDGTADDTAAIQAAIDYALYNNLPVVYLPPGTYSTSDTIHLGYGWGANGLAGYCTIVLEGVSGHAADGAPGSGRTRIVATFDDRPIINIQGGRDSGIRRLWLSGKGSLTPVPWSVSLAYAADSASYVIAGAKDDANAPYCAVAIDGYGGTTPANPYPTPSYPAWMTAPAAAYGGRTSSDCFVEDCRVESTVVGIAVQSNCNANGDFMKFRNCVFQSHKVGISIGQVNARSTDYQNCNFNIVHTCIDSVTYKIASTQGNFAGNLSNIHANQCWRFLNVNMDWSVSTVVTNFYCENMGEIGVGTGGKSRMSFIGCSFELLDCRYSGTTPTETYPSVAWAGNNAMFESCSFTGARVGFTFTGSNAPIFRNCFFRPLTYFSQAYYTSAAEKLAVDWFGGIFFVAYLVGNGATPFIQRCAIQGVSTTNDYDSLDGTGLALVHSIGVSYGSNYRYLLPTAMQRGDPAGFSGIKAADRSASGRGFAVTTTNTMYQVGDVIALSSVWRLFYLESITDNGDGTYTHQWNALCFFSLVSGTYTPDPIWETSDLLYYFPIGIKAVYVSGRYFKTTLGSNQVDYVDGLGVAKIPAFTAARKVLWLGANAGPGIQPLRPFAASDVKINSIDGVTGVLTMSQNAAITAWWADCAGLCLVKLGA